MPTMKSAQSSLLKKSAGLPEKKASVHVDAVQSLGKIPIDVKK
jgi:cysteine sulfinate desulfinase/cysteine desulfurase-like protein